MELERLTDNDVDGATEHDNLDNPPTKEPEGIFSGNYSQGMWDDINNAQTVADLRSALYFVCCRIQELEAKVNRP
jgi:hypothetical protein